MIDAEYPLIKENIALPYVVCGIGRSACQSHVNREQGMCVHQLMYTVSGKGTVRCMGSEYTLETGQAVVLRKKVPHEYYPSDEIGWGLNWVIFDGCGIDGILDYYGLDGASPVTLTSISAIDDVFRKCFRTLKLRDKFCVRKASPMLDEMLLNVYLSKFDNTSEQDTDDVLSPAVDYINENYGSTITLEELAKITGVGREYFCSLFRRKFGMRPFEYIAMKRVQTAKELLASTEMSIADIGKIVGYDDKSYFGHVFKRYAGMSPTAFRGY